MNEINTSLEKIDIEGHELHLFIPDQDSVRNYYRTNASDFPYWSQVWPAAIGLCSFLVQHNDLIKDKHVVEFAAGLGLPSLFAAQYATSVTMSDYLPEIVQLMQQTIDHNQLSNLHCELVNWNDVPTSIKADVLLLSDVNYEPDLFDKVAEVIARFLQEGSLVVLSTPQRLMAKPFIERLLPFTHQQEEIVVERNGVWTPISILVLSRQ